MPTESEIRTTPPTDPEPRRTTRLRSERAEFDVTPPRSESRPTVAGEHDFQNLFHALLRAFFDDGRGVNVADYRAHPGVQGHRLPGVRSGRAHDCDPENGLTRGVRPGAGWRPA